MNQRLSVSRRGVLKACLGAAWFGPVEGKSRVVISRDPPLRAAGATPDSRRVLNLLDRALQASFDSDSPVDAWKQVVRPGEVVGLKVNCLAGRGTASTSVRLVEAVCERLQQAGVSRERIVIWDRLASDLDSGGFRGQRIRCVGNDEAGYEDTLAVFGSAGSLMSRTLTRTCDAVINLPVLKDHGIAGVSMALKNLFGAIHNPNKYHGIVGDPYVADVYMLPPIRQKVRLTICDAMTAQYDGGPSYMPQWSWPFNGLIVAQDPVALDYTGWQLIETKRAEKHLPSLRALNREPVWIATAADARHRLGTNDPKRIERVEV